MCWFIRPLHLERDIEVAGHVMMELWAKSIAVDTDFTAKLVDVWPNGFAQNLTEGIVRGRYRDSQEKPELLNPGQPYKLMWTCGRPAMCSKKATRSGWRSAAVISHGSTGT